MPARRLSEADRAVWAAYTAALPASKAQHPAEPSKPILTRPARTAPAAKPGVPADPRAGGARLGLLTINVHPAGLDKASWQRFRSGLTPVGRRLDLHGITVQRAHERFLHLLSTASAQGVRCVEVITGRGNGETSGVLRRELPLWINLAQTRPLILAASHPHAANDGAVRLLLRRG